MILKDFKAFKGQHCETTATGTLLKHIGIDLSEPLLFGLGEGLGFIFWKMKSMAFPFIGGRVKTDLLTENICTNLNLILEAHETSSKRKAWNLLVTNLDAGKTVGLKLDCYHLEYFSNKFHFAGHYVAAYGYDDQFVYLVDTAQQGCKVKTRLANLEKARSEKGPMSSPNRTFMITGNEEGFDLKKAIPTAIRNNTRDYLNPPIKNMGYKGILKLSTTIKKWFEQSKDVKSDFQTSAMLMEKAGTGGSLFRKLYRDFLQESAAIIKSVELEQAAAEFSLIAKHWTTVSELFHQAGASGNIQFIHQAAEILTEISQREKKTMEGLQVLQYS